MFIIVVALLFVLIVGAVSFTDVVDNGVPSLKSVLSQAMRIARLRQ